MFRSVLVRITGNFRAHPAMSSAAAADRAVLHDLRQQLVRPLDRDAHKGQSGRLGIVGGCDEYTGAPFLAAMAALRTGADLVHVFCTRSAGPVIKAYGPELIVHPVLNAGGDSDVIHGVAEQWLPRLHALVVGPGLGRDAAVLSDARHIIAAAGRLRMPLIVDADGLHLIGTAHPDALDAYPAGLLILTPNAVEMHRLRPHDDFTNGLNGEFTVLAKAAPVDRVWQLRSGDKRLRLVADCLPGGSARRCGGQGDILAGVLAAFWIAAQQNAQLDALQRAALSCRAASWLTRRCNERAFAVHGRGMLASDMLAEVASVFRDYFEVD